MSTDSDPQGRQPNVLNEMADLITHSDSATAEEIGNMVGGLQLGAHTSASSLIVQQEQVERHAVKTETHSGANATIERWSESYTMRHQKKEPASPKATVEIPSTGSLTVIPKGSHGLIGTSLASISTTPIEDIRREKGLDKERSALYEKLDNICGLKKGISMIREWTKANLNQECKNMTQIRNLFPQLTATEISMLPLLSRIPDTFLLYGTNFNSLTIKRVADPRYGLDEDLRQEDLNETPSQLEMRVDGIAYGTETTNLHEVVEEETTSQVNVLDREIVPYTDEVSTIIERLILLSIDMPRLFERLQQNMTDALQVGVGIIQREAMERVRGLEPTPVENTEPTSTALATIMPVHIHSVEVLSEALRNMKPAKNAQRLSEEQKIADQLMEADISLEGKSKMSLQAIVHVIGLLDTIPHSFLLSPPFRGSIRFHGTQILIANDKDEIIEVCPLSAECARVAKQTIFDETRENSDRNRTMLEVGQQLTTMAQTKIFGKFATGEQTIDKLAPTISGIEEFSLRTMNNTGVTLAVLGEGSLDSLRHLGTDGDRTITGGMIMKHRLKMGLSEARQMHHILNRLGPRLLQRVKVVNKLQVKEITEESFKRGQIADVMFDNEKGVLTILEPQILPYSRLVPAAQTERDFLVAYGCGASLWPILLTRTRQKWEFMHRAPEQSIDIKKRLADAKDASDLIVLAGDVLSEIRPLGPHATNNVSITAMESPEADFCAHFACFVLCRDEFKEKGKTNRVIHDKYASIEKLMQLLDWDEKEISEGSVPVGEAEGGLSAQIPSLPDLNDVESLFAFLIKSQEREEKKAEEASVDENDETSDVSSDAEREVVEERSKIEKAVTEVLLGILDLEEVENFDNLEMIVNEIVDILRDEEEEYPEEEIRSYLENISELEDFGDSDDVIEDIITVLKDVGLLESEE